VIRGAIGLLWVLLIAAALGFQWLRGQTDVGAGYVAKELCSCIYIGGREPGSCRPDVPPEMDVIDAEVGEDRVRAFVPYLGERIARFEPPYGCVLY
jgi:hypothetical protein